MPDEPSATYLYAIAHTADAEALVNPELVGLGDLPLYAVVADDLVALVSDAPRGRIRPQRKLLAAHQGALKALGERAAVLPSAFGIVAPEVTGLAALLRRERATLLDQLELVQGCTEMTMRVRMDVENVFADFVSRYDELREMREEIEDGASRDKLIEVGQFFERLQQQERQSAFEQVNDVLSKVCKSIIQNDPRDEADVINIACLVPVDAVEAFEAGVNEAAELFDDRHTFEYSGPWPLFNFVQLHLNFDDAEDEAQMKYEILSCQEQHAC